MPDQSDSSSELLQRILQGILIDVFDLDLRTGAMSRSGSLSQTLELPNSMGLEEYLQRVPSPDQDRIRHRLKTHPSTLPHYRIAYRIAAPSGGFVVIQDDAEVEYDAMGDPIRLTGISRDVSDEALVRQQLAREQHRLSLALQASSMGSFDWDPRSDELQADEALHRLLQVEKGQLEWGRQFFSRMHPEDIDRVQREVRRVLASRKIYETEFRMFRPNGQMFWCAGRGCVMIEHSSGAKHLVGMNWDITEKKETEFRLQQARDVAEAANRSKSAFLANMSHEIRTPMTAILGYTDLAQSSNDTEERDAYLQTIRRNSHYLLEIINDILDLSKIEAGKIESVADVFSPGRLIADVQSIMDVRAKEKSLELSVHLDHPIPAQIKSDSKRLKQILINLVGNAIKFTAQGGVKIKVRYVTNAGNDSSLGVLEIDVIDSGIGMTRQQLESIFEPFTQGDSRINRRFGGTGLGLTISQRLASLLGGEILVESQVGQGSKFTCRIAAESIKSQAPSSSSCAATDSSGKPSTANVRLDCSILVVDDRRDIRLLSRSILTKAGATVLEAVDGLDAIHQVSESLAGNQPIDCLVLDMQMPRLDGYRTASRLRRMGFDQPIIALTAEAMDGDFNRCLSAGCDDYLSKPIDTAKLLEMVAKLTNNPKARQRSTGPHARSSPDN